MPATISTALSRNGTRHAHWPPSGTRTKKARLANSYPTGMPACVIPV